MMRLVPREGVQVVGLWSLPVVLLLGYAGMERENTPPVPVDSGPGYSWLSLPFKAGTKSQWMSEWRQLHVVTPHDTIETKPRVPAAGEGFPQGIATAPERPFRIRLTGQVRDGKKVLYCFFDTEDRRWFRMADGGVDPEAGIRLELSPAGGQPLVTDLEDGTCYVLLASETRLERAGFSDNTELEKHE